MTDRLRVCWLVQKQKEFVRPEPGVTPHEFNLRSLISQQVQQKLSHEAFNQQTYNQSRVSEQRLNSCGVTSGSGRTIFFISTLFVFATTNSKAVSHTQFLGFGQLYHSFLFIVVSSTPPPSKNHATIPRSCINFKASQPFDRLKAFLIPCSCILRAHNI